MLPNFARPVDVELVLQAEITGAEKIAAAEYALLTVSAAIRNYCRQTLSLVEDDEIVFTAPAWHYAPDRRYHLLLPELPVIEVSAVTEDGTVLVLADDYALGRYGLLYRVGRPWNLGRQTVAITYTHGYAVIPDAISTVCARAASRLYQAGLRASETAGVPGVVSKSLGDFAVTFGVESVTEGTMGASGARVLLLSEKDELDEFRMKP